MERTIVGADPGGPYLCRLVHAVRDGVVACGNRCRTSVVCTHDLRAGNLRQVLVECLLDALDRAVVVEVVDIDIGEDRAVQRQLEMGAVALVGFDDEPIATGPLCSGTHVGDVATDHETRAQICFGQNQHQHRRGRGLAVCSGDGDRLGLGTDRCQHACPAEHRDAQSAGLVELVQVGRNCRRRSDSVAADDVRSFVSDVHGHTGRPQPIEHLAFAQVDSRHVMTHLGQGQRDRTHARTRRPDHVQTPRRRQIQRSGRNGGGGGFGHDAHDGDQASGTGAGDRGVSEWLFMSAAPSIRRAGRAPRCDVPHPSGTPPDRAPDARRRRHADVRSHRRVGRSVAREDESRRLDPTTMSRSESDDPRPTRPRARGSPGVPVAATSCTVLAPPTAHQQVTCGVDGRHVRLVADRVVQQPIARLDTSVSVRQESFANGMTDGQEPIITMVDEHPADRLVERPRTL